MFHTKVNIRLPRHYGACTYMIFLFDIAYDAHCITLLIFFTSYVELLRKLVIVTYVYPFHVDPFAAFFVLFVNKRYAQLSTMVV